MNPDEAEADSRVTNTIGGEVLISSLAMILHSSTFSLKAKRNCGGSHADLCAFSLERELPDMMSASEGEGVTEKQLYQGRLPKFYSINQFQMRTRGV